ncbi:MAG TPA: acyltransferase [Allosphingosinicella sp.]|jgi:exopolysaccharide production protein ExoZ
MLTNLQALRALAAIGVVVFHFGLLPATSVPFTVGAAGVDLFFVLSGFIIAHSSARSARHFLAHRLIRVLPAYWIATAIAALFTLQALAGGEALDWLVQSLFYLPGPGGRPALIFVAWTLVYELVFYLLYWVALRCGPERAPLVALPALLVLGLASLPGAPGPWPLLLEFAIGVGIFLLAERTGALRRVPGAAGLAFAALGLALLPALPLLGYIPVDYDSGARVLCWGLPAGAVVLGLVAAERGGLAIRSRFVLLLGAASYAIYLLHPIAVGQLLQLPPPTPPLNWLYCGAAVVVTVGIAVVFHLWVEAPMLRGLRALLRDPPPVEQRIVETPVAEGGGLNRLPEGT